MRLFLGVDGGQSSTTALIGDESGRVIGYGRGGPCNHVGAAEGRAKFVGAIGGCVGDACRAAGLDPAAVRFSEACLGFSGGPADKQALLHEILRADRMEVTTDALIGLVGATGGEPGMVAIAGTGSISLGRNEEGRTARAGGWGYIYGDEGGGFDITRQAVRAALRFEEGWGPETRLRAMLLEETGARDANDLVHRLYTTAYPRPVVASYSKLVDRAAMDGDAVARNILLNAAQQLATFVSAVRAQLFGPGVRALVAYVGGVFHSGLLLERFRLLAELDEGSHVIAPRYLPAAGALIEAYRLAGHKVTLTDVPEVVK